MQIVNIVSRLAYECNKGCYTKKIFCIVCVVSCLTKKKENILNVLHHLM